MVDIDGHKSRQAHILLLAPGAFLPAPVLALHLTLVIALGTEVDKGMLPLLIVREQQQFLLVRLVDERLPLLLGHVLAVLHKALAEPFRNLRGLLPHSGWPDGSSPSAV